MKIGHFCTVEYKNRAGGNGLNPHGRREVYGKSLNEPWSGNLLIRLILLFTGHFWFEACFADGFQLDLFRV
jgi:hypothetical protein